MPVTIYKSSFVHQVKMTEMSFTRGLGRTYKYWSGDPPLFPFGFGLSYTTFSLAWRGSGAPAPVVVHSTNDTLTLSVDVANTGGVAGDEVLNEA